MEYFFSFRSTLLILTQNFGTDEIHAYAVKSSQNSRIMKKNFSFHEKNNLKNRLNIEFYFCTADLLVVVFVKRPFCTTGLKYF